MIEGRLIGATLQFGTNLPILRVARESCERRGPTTQRIDNSTGEFSRVVAAPAPFVATKERSSVAPCSITSSPFMSGSPEPGSPRLRAVGLRASEAQIDFRARTRTAPNGQVRANLLGAFAYARETKVSGAALVQYFGWNAFPIIPNS